MPTILQLRRGTTAENAAYTGSVGELTVDTELTKLLLHDGSTAGGVDVGDITSVVAGAGMTGGGTEGVATLNVIGGTGITANADEITIDTSIVTTLTGSQTLTNKTLTSPVLDTAISGTAFLDEDNMASNSATKVASQQSIKAYTDNALAALDSTLIADQDGDTQVQVEEGSDDDTIRFDAAGSEMVTINSSGIKISDGAGSSRVNIILDEDNLGSDSSIALATQQSIKAYTDNSLAALVDSSPAALNTLNELAAALGDDANFSTTITNAVAAKLSNVVEDTTPQLGGNLDLNSNQIITTAGAYIRGDDGSGHGLIIHSDTDVKFSAAGGDFTFSNDNVVGIGNLAASTLNSHTVPTGSAGTIALTSDITAGITSKEGGTNFTNSLLVGTDSTGTLNSATSNTGVGVGVLGALTSGDNNVAVGYQALNVNTAGGENTAVGVNALYNNTGNENTATGSCALYTNAGGEYNVAMGRVALFCNTTGSCNTAVGMCALHCNTTGCENTAIGMIALRSNTEGNSNVGVGILSLYKNTTGCYNVGVGKRSLYKNTTANDNTAIGYCSLYNNTTGTENTAVGACTLKVSTGDDNTAIGYNALTANTTGSNSVAIGSCALETQTDGSSNVAVGFCSMQANVGGYANSAVGINSLKGNVSGTYNVAMGRDSLMNNTGGHYNTALGMRSMYTSTGSYNTAGGASAMRGNTTGNYNTAFGHDALYQSAGSNGNTGLGNCSLNQVGTGGNYNSAVGFCSLKLVDSGAYNIGVGSQAGDNITSGSGNVIIGGVDATSATADRQLKIAGNDGTSTTTWIEGNSSGALTFNGAYTFPTADGSANQILTTDGSGAVSFADAAGGGGVNSDVLYHATTTAAGTLVDITGYKSVYVYMAWDSESSTGSTHHRPEIGLISDDGAGNIGYASGGYNQYWRENSSSNPTWPQATGYNIDSGNMYAGMNSGTQYGALWMDIYGLGTSKIVSNIKTISGSDGLHNNLSVNTYTSNTTGMNKLRFALSSQTRYFKNTYVIGIK